jgi:thiol:disulfide interchange protein
MRKASVLVCLLFFLSAITFAQDGSYVGWTAKVKPTTKGNYALELTGHIMQGWHLYLQGSKGDGLDGIKIIVPDSNIQSTGIPSITGTIKTINDPIFQNKKLQVAEQQLELVQEYKAVDVDPASIKIVISYSIANDTAFIPEQKELVVPWNSNLTVSEKNLMIHSIPRISPGHTLNDCGSTPTKADKGLMSLFFIGFLGGLVALFTPCVFPMIPLTVSFFTKTAAKKKRGISNALLYGFFIFLIYILLSLPFHFLDRLDPGILNNVSTNVYLNIFFFIVFIGFAFSFFGYYEITLPGSLSNKANNKAGVGKIAGIFFMALTLAIVSFSCTGPILGSLLAGSLSANGGAMQLTAGMGGFGLALALPFAIFALFPHWLHSLPKSGGWLHVVKVILGFIELALAFKFLSNADQVEHWGILKREIFIGIWVIIGILLTMYLLGVIKFSEDEPQQKISIPRKAFALLIIAFTLYLVPGLTNTKWANLSLISGFPPPLYYSIYHQSDCIFNLDCSHDFDEGMRMAKAEKKPILLDFTGYACVNCRRMEEKVWSKPDILKLMQEKFIVISLYVDDKKSLPAAEQFTYITNDGAEKEIKTYGDKWATFETESFQNNAQPLYALINTDTVLLNRPVSYTPDASEYKNWLQCGLDAFNVK